MSYPAALYDASRAVVQSSAAVLVPMLDSIFALESVIDVGCGEGWFVREFRSLGIQAGGVDQNAPDDLMTFDLEQLMPLEALARHDMVLCLEVAEHLSEQRADSFVEELCKLGKTVVFSAAIPGQGGVDHLNEQWPVYWARKFAACGLSGTGALRQAIWSDTRIAPWYRQNLLVFGDLSDLDPDGCASIVHPEIWGWYR